MATLLVELADEVRGGKIVLSHVAGYSPVYVPLRGLAVLGAETGMSDPFEPRFDASAAHVLQPWQDAVIAQAGLTAAASRLSRGRGLEGHIVVT